MAPDAQQISRLAIGAGFNAGSIVLLCSQVMGFARAFRLVCRLRYDWR